eukprot:3266908-Pyramimonas_sp.AAC.2
MQEARVYSPDLLQLAHPAGGQVAVLQHHPSAVPAALLDSCVQRHDLEPIARGEREYALW